MTNEHAPLNDLDDLIPIEDQESEDDLKGRISFKDAVSLTTDWTLETLNNQLEKGNIDLMPGFQRRAAWDEVRKSRLIESVIVGIPVPNIVIAENKVRRGSFIVLDGKQRLVSINDYYRGQFPLRGLDIRTDLNGMTYQDLPPDDRTYLDNSTLRATVIRNWSDENFLYTVFFRLNSGSLALSPQELRKALIGGRLLDRIERYIGESVAFHTLFGQIPDRRMRDSELVLRFLAFDRAVEQYQGDLKQFLDSTTGYFESTENADELEERLQRLELALSISFEIFGRNAFKKWTGGAFERRINRAVFDCITRFFADINIATVSAQHREAVVEKFQQTCADPSFREAIERTTKTTSATRHRLQSWGEGLAEIIGRQYDQDTLRIV